MSGWALVGLCLVAGAWGQSGPYYGLPVGSLFYTADGTKGDIYASDPRTIMAVKFKQQARDGCTSFMAGPAKGGDEGVLLPVRVRSGDLRIQRTKRGVNMGAGFPWGVAAFASLNSFGPMGNLRMPEEAKGAQPSSSVSFEGIDLDTEGAETDGWFAPQPLGAEETPEASLPIGPAMPPHLAQPTTKAPVTQTSIPSFPKAKMMPIGEIMKMRSAAHPAKIPKKEAAAVEEHVEEKPSSDGIIVFDPQETKDQTATAAAPAAAPRAPRRRVNRPRPVTRTSPTRPNNNRRNNRRRNNRPATTVRPRRRFTFPPAHLLPGYTPTASYRNRRKSTRAPRPRRPSQRRPSRPATRRPVAPSSVTPFRVVRRRTTTGAPSTTEESSTTTPDVVSTTLIPLQILPREPVRGDRIAGRSDSVESVESVEKEESVEEATEEPQLLPVIRTNEEAKISQPLIRFHPTEKPDNEIDGSGEGSSAEIGTGLIMLDLNSNETEVDVPSEVHPSFRKPLPRYPGLYDRSDDEAELFFHTNPPTTQAPSTTSGAPTTPGAETSTIEAATEVTEPFSVATATTKDPVAASKISIGDLEWHVVEDPRAHRRKPPTTADPDAPTPLPNSEPLSSTSPPPPPPELPSPAPGSIYALPQVTRSREDDLIAAMEFGSVELLHIGINLWVVRAKKTVDGCLTS